MRLRFFALLVLALVVQREIVAQQGTPAVTVSPNVNRGVAAGSSLAQGRTATCQSWRP